MRIAHEWLQALLGPLPPADEVARLLTLQGLEVETVERCGAGLEGAEIARIRTLEPRGDHLSLLELETAGGPVTVVTGAPNVATGQMVPWAKPGTRLPDGRVLREAEFLGIVSHGMLLSADEMGLGEDHDGILILPADAPLGGDVAEYLGLPREVLEISLTPSFATHCQSALGVARELGARLGIAAHGPSPVPPEAADAGIAVRVASPEICPAYLGARFRRERDVPTPLWMRLRLLTSGMRSVHPFVDLTNYVMLEIGQPLHPFAADRLEGEIQVRLAHAGETMRTLDGQERSLSPDDIVIADRGGPVALAGVMGSERLEMSRDTKDVFLEAALFDPARIGRTSRRLALRSEAAQRFVHEVDPTLPWRAVARMRDLAAAVGFEALPGLTASAPMPSGTRVIDVDPARVRTLLGMDLSHAEQAEALEQLGFTVQASPGQLEVGVPPHRPDVRMLADVAEEILRAVGIDRLPEEVLPPSATLPEPPGYLLRLDALDAFVRLGYRETMSYSLEDPKTLDVLARLPAVRVLNPLSSDASVLRTTLLPGLLGALRRNLAYGVREIALVEAGQTFAPASEAPVEEARIATLLFAQEAPPSRFQSELPDFFSLKGDVLAALEELRVPEPDVAPGTDPMLHPGRQATVRAAGVEIGCFGELHPAVAQRLSLPPGVLVAELSLAAIARAQARPTVRPLPRYPALSRDLAVVVRDSVPYGQVAEVARGAAGSLLEELHLFDVYEGAEGRPVPAGSRSMALRLLLRSPERTLTEEDAGRIMAEVLEALARTCDARLR